MAESFLFSSAESLIAKLASRVYEEASEVLGVYDHLREFKKTLLLVKAVLLDAEQKQEQSNELRQWLRQLKHVFSDAEDVLDEFECQTLRKKVVKAHGTTKDKVSSPTIIVERAGSFAWTCKSWRIREEFARTITSAIGLFSSTELPLQRAILPPILQLLNDLNPAVRQAAILCIEGNSSD